MTQISATSIQAPEGSGTVRGEQVSVSLVACHDRRSRTNDWTAISASAATDTRAGLLGIIDDRANVCATNITHQLPIEQWRDWIGDPTVTDSIRDRLLQRCWRFELHGQSLRTPRDPQDRATRPVVKSGNDTSA